MTPPTNFQHVTNINYIAGKTNQSTWQAAEQQLKVIAGEYDEVVEAIAERNLDKLRDGIADLLVTAYGMGSVLGYNVDDDMASVTSSLMTRFDATQGDAELTKQKYLDVGIETHIRTTRFPETQLENERVYYVTISSKDQVNQKTGEHIPAGKFLKSWKYRDAELSNHPECFYPMSVDNQPNVAMLKYRPYFIGKSNEGKTTADRLDDKAVSNG